MGGEGEKVIVSRFRHRNRNNRASVAAVLVRRAFIFDRRWCVGVVGTIRLWVNFIRSPRVIHVSLGLIVKIERARSARGLLLLAR